MIRRVSLVVSLGALALLALSAPANANTAVFGSDLSATSNSNACLTDCTAVQLSQPSGAAPLPLTSPANGVITEWAIRSTDNVTYAFRVLRPAGTDAYTGVATSLGVDPGTSDAILRYPVSLVVRRGDAIGIGPASGDIDAGVPSRDAPVSSSYVWAINSVGQPADGATASFTPQSGHELLLQATVRFCSVPSLKRLKKVAAKEALAAADCGVKVKKRTTQKGKFRGKVLKQKTPSGTTAAPGTVVPIVIGRK